MKPFLLPKQCRSNGTILHVFILITSSALMQCFPVNRLSNITRLDVRHADLLPPDHVAGAHMEHDGDINEDFHHEAFLGTLVKEGKLIFENMEGYRRLIDIFHKVDTNKDHNMDEEELKSWIHDRIVEHYNSAKESSEEVFQKVDYDNDSSVLWGEYKASLAGLDPRKFHNANISVESDRDGPFGKEAEQWIKADYDGDSRLTRQEFISFLHPEHNRRTLDAMTNELLQGWDHDHDGKISLEEFSRLPEGEVQDPEEQEMDRQYQLKQIREFKEDMDLDSDGIVTWKELNVYLDPRHKQHASKEATYLIEIADRNKDKKISEHEMLMNYKMFTGSSLTNYVQILHDEF